MKQLIKIIKSIFSYEPVNHLDDYMDSNDNILNYRYKDLFK
jgi:hypothetical protein